MSDPIDFAKRVDSMDEEDKEQFKEIINALSFCYVKDGVKAIVIIDKPSGLVETMTVNCDDMEAFNILNATKQYFEFVNTADAPPKEQFN